MSAIMLPESFTRDIIRGINQHRLRDRRSLTYTAGRLRLAASGGPVNDPRSICEGRVQRCALSNGTLKLCH